jgi:hypothetical protein
VANDKRLIAPAHVVPWSARTPGPAVISQVLRGRDSLTYPEDKPGGARRFLRSIMTAQVIKKDHAKPINLAPIDIFPV